MGRLAQSGLLIKSFVIRGAPSCCAAAVKAEDLLPDLQPFTALMMHSRQRGWRAGGTG